MSKISSVVYFLAAPTMLVLFILGLRLRDFPKSRPLPQPAPRVRMQSDTELGIELPPVRFHEGLPTMDSLSWRVAALVRSNPDQEFARAMDSAIVSGELTITWGNLPHSSASFMVLEPASDPSVRVLDTQLSAAPVYMPAIMVGVDYIVNLNTRSDVVFMQLVLQHEYQHYRQWRDADAQRKLMSLKLNMQLPPDVMEATTGIPRHEVCQHMVESEVEAYTLECTSVLARQTPRHLLPEICHSVDSPHYAAFIEANMRAASPEIWRFCP